MKRVGTTHLGVLLATMLLVLHPARSHAESADATRERKLAHFEAKVRPLLITACAECHGPDKQKGKLRLDSPEGIAAGGTSGKLFVAGDPKQSLIIRAVRHIDDDLAMPPKRKLKPSEIDALTRWVGGGAVLPVTKPTAEPDPKVDIQAAADAAYDWKRWESFWSLKPITAPPLPKVTGSGWSTHPIDRFVLTKLEAAKITPNAQADRRTLIRRATLDLIGLPPTPEEVEAFLKDPSPDAYEKLIDRLLASPHYGERWGRHWLDLARYVQGRVKIRRVHGVDGAEPYRDYVVRAFNQDKPYDRFLTEQLAGDLLPVPKNAAKDPKAKRQYFDQITATAFLSIGSWFEECPDPNRLRLDMIDEMLDVTTRTFMGMTVACARCHDHKFDPIPAADYYALAGIFRNTRVLDRLSKNWKDGRLRHVRPLALPDEVLEIADEREAIQADMECNGYLYMASQLHPTLLEKWKKDEAKYRRVAAELREKLKTKKMSFAIQQWPAARIDGQVNLKITPEKRGDKTIEIVESAKPYASWVRYMVEVPKDGEYAIEARYAVHGDTSVIVKLNGNFQKNQLLFPDSGDVAETQGWIKGDRFRWARVGTVTLREGYSSMQFHMARGMLPRLEQVRLYRHLPEREAIIEQAAQKAKLNPLLLRNFVKGDTDPYPTAAGIEPYLEKDEQHFRDWLVSTRAKLAKLDKAEAAFPKTIGVEDAGVMPGNVLPRKSAMVDLPIHVNGNPYHTSEQTVPRGVPRLARHLVPDVDVPNRFSGRLAFAEWLTHPRHPLTARVMANRIWHWHFGRGIVRTTSDFGSRGSGPTHPALLDHLARTFIDNGWSIKAMHRHIMLSNTYRMSSRVQPNQQAIDPDNGLHWRFPSRRLEVEAIYDSMIACFGKVPRQSGKPGQTPTLDFAKSADRAMYILTSGRSPSGYGLQIRKMFPVFGLEHEAVMISERDRTPTPAQALWWLNNPLPKMYARKFADQLMASIPRGKNESQADHDHRMLGKAYMLAYGRKPTTIDIANTDAYIKHCRRYKVPEKEIWKRVCHAIYNSTEFQTLR